MQISVTATHIQNGIRNGAKRCPVALAINEQVPDAKALCGYNLIFFDYGGLRQRVETPYAVGEFMNGFDTLEHVEPFVFSLNLEGSETDLF